MRVEVPVRTQPGHTAPLGATWDGDGVSFGLFSSVATAVDLCLFDLAGCPGETRVPLEGPDDDVWHLYVHGLGPGQRYAYRVHGPWEPHRGHRCDPATLLLDPYARTLSAPPSPHPAPGEVFSQVVDPAFEWGDDTPPAHDWHRTVIYEVHVGGFTRRHPEVPESLRGTYLGLASAAALSHLQRLGVTAVELLPVHYRLSESALVGRGLSNYWGYNTINFFTPDPRFATSPDRAIVEFKTMVRALHAAGIEVLLDVVFNHTAEAGVDAPTWSWRGLDNAAYYRLDPRDPARYDDVTGCGNTLDLSHPRVLQLVLDSLRYWVGEMHVDGFRFDLATALVREGRSVDMGSGFLDALRQDPLLSRAKLIVEPWDLGPEGHQTGRFPARFREWNDRYRDAVRRYWRGDEGRVPELATRLAGSSDLFGPGRRGPTASINYVTSHDGFTLADLVAYERKRNDGNGEANADGATENYSWNCGHEGPTDDVVVTERRARFRRSVLATLLVSQGVPMLTAGDELGRTQHGNNNAYCQDNETSWVDWQLDRAAEQHLAFVTRLIACRANHPVLGRRYFLLGRSAGSDAAPDLLWFTADGRELVGETWVGDGLQAVAMWLDGDRIGERSPQGDEVRGDTLLVLFNAGPHAVEFRLPHSGAGPWRLEFDTADPSADALFDPHAYQVEAGAVAVLVGAARSV